MALVQNKKAGFNYEFLEKYDGGIRLLGFEVKALKKGLGSLEGAYVIIRGGEAFVVGMQIPPYQPANTPKEYDPVRPRKLLLAKKEIRALADIENKRGLTIVPISVYNKKQKIKMQIAVGRGKKQYDKRESIKKKDTEREINRELKEYH